MQLCVRTNEEDVSEVTFASNRRLETTPPYDPPVPLAAASGRENVENVAEYFMFLNIKAALAPQEHLAVSA